MAYLGSVNKSTDSVCSLPHSPVKSFGATLNALCEFFETPRSAFVDMINLSRRNASVSDLDINSHATIQEPLLFGNKHKE